MPAATADRLRDIGAPNDRIRQVPRRVPTGSIQPINAIPHGTHRNFVRCSAPSSMRGSAGHDRRLRSPARNRTFIDQVVAVACPNQPSAIRIVQQCTAIAPAAALLPPNGDESNAEHCPTPPVGWVADEDSTLHPPLAHPPAPEGSPHGGSPGAGNLCDPAQDINHQSHARKSDHRICETYNRMQIGSTEPASHDHPPGNLPQRAAGAAGPCAA